MGQQIIESIRSHIFRNQPGAQVDVWNVADGASIPDYRGAYDLITLTGGTFNLIAGTPAAWIESVLSLIRDTVEQGGKTKLLGFCWGHQAIHHALGGDLGTLSQGSRVSRNETVAN